jgi:aspartate racemase
MSGRNLTSLIEAVVDEAKRRKLSTVGVLASPMTIRTKLYETPLLTAGIKVVLPTAREQERLESMIRRTIAGQHVPVTGLQRIVQDLHARGAEQCILGCTELSVVMADTATDNFLDPLHIITNKLLEQS